MAKNKPAYRKQSGRDQAVVTLRDAVTGKRKPYYLGRYDSPESHERYHHLVATWEARGRRLPDQPDEPEHRPATGPTVSRVLADYMQHVAVYYVDGDGNPTTTQGEVKQALAPVRAIYGKTPAREFGPKALKQVRQTMREKGWARPTINKRIDIIRRAFKWAVGEELVGPSVHEALRAVPGLRKGEAGVREGRDVKPVAEHVISATLPYVSDQVAAMIRLQLRTAARPGEIVLIRPIDLDTSGKVSTYEPESHKGSHRGDKRIIYIGPEGQRILEPWLSAKAKTDAYLFDPREAQTQAIKAATNPRYTVNAYRKGVTRACDKAFPPPEHLQRRRVAASGRKHERWETDREYRQRLGAEGWAELQQWQRDHRWHPHQLRHNAGTYLRREFGIEAARVILGHSDAGITAEVYSEQDQEKAKEIIGKVG